MRNANSDRSTASAAASIAAFVPQSRNAHQPMTTTSKAPIDKLGRRANQSIRSAGSGEWYRKS